MCGIAGVYDTSGADTAVLDPMLDCITHRGPDEAGRHVDPDGTLAMGMRRLSIVDLSGGSQPIYNEDGTVAVVFNGEIYNHEPVRAALERAGHEFTTASDTEVLVHGWEEYGRRLPEHLDGMFAFAVWDTEAGRLFLARDRLGIKPLYYALSGDGGAGATRLAWGSELPAVLATGAGTGIDRRAVYNFFSLRYSPGPRTLVSGVRKLPPGTSMTVGPDGTVNRRQYWELPARRREIGFDAAADRVSELLEGAVEQRLMADVPVGAFLSGGLDSSAIAALAAKHHDETLKTFSIGFPGQPQDESDEAAFVADRLGTDHHRQAVDLDSMELFSDLVTHYGEPLADPAALPTMLLSRAAREEVKVVLTGEGADELFAGYRRHRVIPRARRVARHLPSPVFRAAGGVANRLPDELADARRYARFAASLESDEAAVLDAARGYSDVRADRYLDARTDPRDSGLIDLVRDSFEQAETETLQRLCAFDVTRWLPDDLLYKVDHASMAASLEARVPFLDHRLVAFAHSVPGDLKTGGYKRLLNAAVADVVPERTRQRSKHGFNVPVSDWFRRDHEAISGWLAPDRVESTPYLAAEDLSDLRAAHRAGTADHGMTLWKCLTYVAWYHTHGHVATASSDPS